MAKGEGGRIQVWPGLAVPLGFTLLLGLACWLFAGRLEAGRERVADDARRLEAQARREAAEISAAAGNAASEFVSGRLAARNAKEQNLRIEAKGVMESVGRLIKIGMEKNRRRTAVRREVGAFPSGFEGVKRTLEIMPQEESGDPARAVLEANAPELAALLPAGFALTVVEDHAREMLAVGGSGGGEGMLTAAVTRDMIFDDGRSERRWTLRLEVKAPDQNPPPTAREVAEFLERRFGGVRPDLMAWRGWLVGAGGEIAAAFPVELPAGAATPPYIDAPGQWKLLDGGSLVWLEPLRAPGGMGWKVGVSIMIPAPEREVSALDALEADWSWAATLGGFGLACLLSWGWFVLGCRASPAARPEGMKAPVPPPAARPERRLVRDPAAKRGVTEDESVIVADIEPGGKVSIQAPPMPNGSLFRLQTIHRGRPGLPGSRVLDRAKSPLLKEMAVRVRPPAGGVETGASGGGPKPGARVPPVAAPLPSMKQGTISGWKKVAE